MNNTKTRTIEPHPTLSKVIVRAFEEFSTGKHTLGSLAEFLAELGLDTKKAKNFASSENYKEMKRFVQKVGTNPKFLDKIVSFNFVQPFDFLAEMNSKSFAEPRATCLPVGMGRLIQYGGVILAFARTFFDQE